MDSTGGGSWYVEEVAEGTGGGLCDVCDVYRTCDHMSWDMGD